MRELDDSAVAKTLVEGLVYPATKAEVLDAARKARVDDVVTAALERIPDRTYEDERDLVGALNAAG